MLVRMCLVSTVRIHRETLWTALTSHSAIEVVATYASAADAVAGVAALRPSPEVILCDLTVSECVGFAPASQRALPGVRLVALGVDDFEPEILVCAKAGMSGFVSREATLAELVDTLTGVVRNELPCSPAVAAKLFHRLATPVATEPGPSLSLLTAREREVLGLIREGLANKEIGTQLQISEATVKNHVHHLLEKLQVKRRVQAARLPASMVYRLRAG